ncbi:MAG: polysaccharide deacetylase family protein [Thalassobaculales bacterium]
MTGWPEITALAAAGRLRLWWRDDDAVADTPALRRLLAIAGRAGIRVGVAVVAGRAEPGLVPALAGHRPLVHGWLHANHAPAGTKKSEFCAGRPEDDLRAALARMAGLFGPALVPALVPPWNRIDATLARALPGLGYRGLSTFGLWRAEGGPRLQVNTHVDIIDWHGTRGFAGDRVLAELAGRAAKGESTGVLTHHLVHDEAAWAFLERLAGVPGIAWDDPAALLGGIAGEGRW